MIVAMWLVAVSLVTIVQLVDSCWLYSCNDSLFLFVDQEYLICLLA
jgi:hypothetical protein